MDVKDKVVVVTGGSRGIGRAIVEELSRTKGAMSQANYEQKETALGFTTIPSVCSWTINSKASWIPVNRTHSIGATIFSRECGRKQPG